MMLSERVQKLMAAAVDGDLDRRQRRQLEQALQQSDEARRYFEALQNDARRLRHLPRNQLPADFASQVLNAIGSGAMPIRVAVGRAAQRYLPLWANFAAAAAVLLAVSIGTYLVVTLNDQQKAARQAAERRDPQLPSPANPPIDLSGAGFDIARQVTEGGAADVAVTPKSESPEDGVEAVPMPELPDTPEPDSKALTVPFNPRINLFKVEPKLPPILPIRELDQAMHKTAFVDALKGEDACQVDLFTKDANKAFERVQNILREQGARVVVDAVARRRFLARAKTNYLFFAEMLTPEEVARVFAVLAAEERATESKQLEKVVVTPLSSGSHKVLAALLGLKPEQLNLKGKPAAAPDPTKPISDATADQLAKALAEKNAPPAAKSPEPILALSYNPIRPNPAFSKEIREFLAARKDRKPGTVALMLVVRNLD